MAETSKQRLLRYLVDAHASELGEKASLKDTADQSLDSEVTAALQQHIETTQAHADMLEQRIEALGGKTSGIKGAVDQLIARGSNFTNAFHDDQDKQTQDLIKLFSLQKFGVATYTSLQAFAQAVSDTDTAEMANTLLEDEKKAADEFEQLIPQLAVASVNRTTDKTINLRQQ